MRKIFVGLNFVSGPAILGFLLAFAVLMLAMTGPAEARQSRPYGEWCSGTSDCAGNLSCHNTVEWNLSNNPTCQCPEPGDGSYSTARNPNTGESRPVCYGNGVPCERNWDPEYGAFSSCQLHLKTEFGQFDSRITGLPENGTYPLRASPDRSARVSGTVTQSDAIWVVWCEPHSGTIWCNVDFGGQDGWIEMNYIRNADFHRSYPDRPRY
jgi:hypothetical protein